MRSPDGRTKLRFWVSRLDQVPEPGTIEEAMFLRFGNDEEHIKILEYRLIAVCANALATSEGQSSQIEEAFKALINACNPELALEEERREKKIRQDIEEDVRRGPFVVKPLPGFDRNDTNVPNKVGRLVRAIQRKIAAESRQGGRK